MAEKHEGGPAVYPVRMDQKFQLQNLRRLAMDPEFESVGQYAGAHSSPAKGQEEGVFGQNSKAHIGSNTALQALHGPELPTTLAHCTFAQPQIQSNNASSGGLQNVGPAYTPGTAFDSLGKEYDTWEMTTSPPRLFMAPLEPHGSTVGASDESSVGTRASSGAFSLISSGEDERLTATDNPVRIPRSVVVDDGSASDPYPVGSYHPSYYTDDSPTPASRLGIWSKGPSLLSRLNFAGGHAHEDTRSNKSVSGESDDVKSQVMPLYDATGLADLYSKPSPAPYFADETIKPRLRRRVPVPHSHGVVTSEDYTPVQPTFPGFSDARYQQGLTTPLGFGNLGSSVAYSGANMANMALTTASGYVGPTSAALEGYQTPQIMDASRPPILGSPIAMARPSPAPFRKGTAFGSGNPTPSLPSRGPSLGPQSSQLTKLLSNFDGTSVATKMLDAEYFPFVETAREGGGPVNYGVIKITNVPFEISRNEVFAFLGRNSRVLPDHLEPIHIIMCRVTGKTLDIYVELQSPADAARAVDRHMDNCAAGRPSKLGDRQVDVLLSDQAGLMKVLFPKAHAVQWVGNIPAIPDTSVSQYQTFRGFLSDEELTMMVKHVDNPARCPFSRGCPERPFECLIGTLKKFPWDKTKHVTLRQRYRIFQTTYRFLDVLKQKIERGVHQVRLTTNLLKRLTAAAMTCPGFTVLQKADIADLVGLEIDRVHELRQPRFADRWRHQYSMSVKTDVPLDIVEWYVRVIAQETKESVDANLSFRERQEIQRLASDTDNYWGYFWLELNLPTAKTLENMTLFDVAEKEFAVMEDVLRRAAKKMAAGGAIQQ